MHISLKKVESRGPYINIFLSKETLFQRVFLKEFSEKSFSNEFGFWEVMIEYSSPNTNKPLFHVAT